MPLFRSVGLVATLVLLVGTACSGDAGPGASPEAGVGGDAGPAAGSGTTPAGGGAVGSAEGSGDASAPPAVDPIVEPGSAPAEDGGVVDPPPGPTGPGPDPLPVPDPAPRFERPEHVRGIYLNAWTAGSSRRVEQLVELARRTEVNTFVIDLKDATGFVSYASGVPAVREAGATTQIRIRDLPALLGRLEAEGIYPIARIVIVKDPVLIAHRPELAVQDTAGGVWVDGKDFRWLNLFDERVWEYHVELAREAIRYGFPEIQWDYVRFADAPLSELQRATYPGRDGRPKASAVRDFLAYSQEALHEEGARVTADVFGVTTSAHDVGIGQIWDRFVDVVDHVLPMVYPSHYWRGSFGVAAPNAHPYEIVVEALGRGLRRSEGIDGAATIIPWLQDFSLGEPPYGAAEVRAQIQAAYDVGIHEWVLWNPGSRYTEEALEPVGGWAVEPLIRVAGRVVPVSEREEALELATAAELDSIGEVPAREAPDSAAAPPDSAVARPDTFPPAPGTSPGA